MLTEIPELSPAEGELFAKEADEPFASSPRMDIGDEKGD